MNRRGPWDPGWNAVSRWPLLPPPCIPNRPILVVTWTEVGHIGQLLRPRDSTLELLAPGTALAVNCLGLPVLLLRLSSAA